MAYDEKRAYRVRDILAGDSALSERKMLGGQDRLLGCER